MMRRMTAALLALILLISAVPVGVLAAETAQVHMRGEVVAFAKKSSAGINYDPNMDPDEPVESGFLWQNTNVEGCYAEDHDHIRDGCAWNGKKYTCGKEPHTHDNGRACAKYPGWKWKVVRDPNYTGWDYDPEEPANYAFAVCAIDPNGVHPMVGVGFTLMRAATEEEKAATGNSKTSVLQNSQTLLTNQRGFAYFDGTCKDTEPAGDAVWTLTQNTRKFSSGGDYYGIYRPHTVQWEVDVTVHEGGTYTVNNIREPGAEEPVSPAASSEVPLPQQGYNKELRRLVMIHEPVTVNLYIDGRFVPQDVEKFDVIITGASGFQDVITMENGEQGWHYVYTAAPDTYSVKADLSGYPLTYKMGYPNQEMTEAEGLELNAEHSNGIFEIHFGTLSNTVKAYAMYTGEDTSISGDFVYGLFADGEEKPAAEFGPDENESEARIGGEDWVELWETYGVDGETIQFTMKQIQAPEYHDTAAEEYTLTIRQAEEGAEEPYVVRLAKAKGDEEVRYGINNEQIATFRNEKPDLSYIVNIKVYDDAQTPNLLPYDVKFALYEDGEKLDLGIAEEIDFSTFDVGVEREFILKQELAPAGYEKDEQEYKITLEWEEDKPVVEVAKNQNVLKRLAAFFSGERIAQDEFGRWIVTFTNKKTDRPEKVINTVELHTIDEDRQYINDDTFSYGLYRDTYENGEVPAVEFVSDETGVIRITSADWMSLAMNNQDLASSADIATLMSGGSIDITLKQSDGGKFHQGSQEEYNLILSKAESGSEDQFKVELSVAAGNEKVRYGENGEQIATFVHNRADLSFGVSISAYDNEETPNRLSGGQYALYENDALVAEYETECDVYDFLDYAAEGTVREFVLKQTKAPDGYTLSEDIYNITVTPDDSGRKVEVTREQTLLENVAAFFSGDGVEQDKYGRWQAKFTSQKIEDPTVPVAKIQLTLDSIVLPSWDGCYEDSEFESSIMEKDYTFKLSWTDDENEVHTDTLVLRSGTKTKTGTFKMDVPVGEEYTVTLELQSDDPACTVNFTVGEDSKTYADKYTGIAVEGTTELKAKPRYKVVAGNGPSSLTLYKVNAKDLSKPLEGAKFALKDGSGTVVQEFTTKKDGLITIDKSKITTDFDEYTLKETAAPEGYVQLKKAVKFVVNLEYSASKDKEGKTVLVQNWTVAPEVDTTNVAQGSDGTYYIKNVYESDMPQTGDTFNPVLWVGLLTASAAAMAVLLISNKRRHGAR